MNRPDFKITKVKNRDPEHQELIFEGDISIFNSVEIQKKIRKLNLKARTVQITLRNIDSLDLSGIQILLSLKKSFAENQARLNIVSGLSDKTTTLLRHTGFEQILLTDQPEAPVK